ncbi:hypothetical protein [Streptomyces sp. NPDC001833]|uniref:hypothetical protein n=1 Tax=Streptomyces sp. NPDC001833 TaxID=3154658 RepID=UPI003328F8E8
MKDSKIVNNTVVPRYPATDSEIRLTNQKDGTPPTGDVVRNNLAHAFNTAAAAGAQHSNNIVVGTSYSTYFTDYVSGDLHLKAGCPAIGAATTRDAPTADADDTPRSSRTT